MPEEYAFLQHLTKGPLLSLLLGEPVTEVRDTPVRVLERIDAFRVKD